MTISAAILTVSDACSRGEREDRSGAALAELVSGRGWRVAASAVVADEQSEIARVLRSWCDDLRIPLILTTGGTGIGPRDVTPEATRPLLDKELPGLGELMRSEGLKHTPMAALSRSIAGTRKASVIVNLPGSPKGAAESFAAVGHLIEHALSMLQGGGHEPKQAA